MFLVPVLAEFVDAVLRLDEDTSHPLGPIGLAYETLVWRSMVFGVAAIALAMPIALVIAAVALSLSSIYVVAMIVVGIVNDATEVFWRLRVEAILPLLVIVVFVVILLNALLRGNRHSPPENALRGGGPSGGPGRGTRSRNVWLISVFVVAGAMAATALVRFMMMAVSALSDDNASVLFIAVLGLVNSLAVPTIMIALGLRSPVLLGVAVVLTLVVALNSLAVDSIAALGLTTIALIVLIVLEVRHRRAAPGHEADPPVNPTPSLHPSSTDPGAAALDSESADWPAAPGTPPARPLPPSRSERTPHPRFDPPAT